MKLSLIIPAKDESQRIIPTVTDLYTTLTKRFGKEFEIIVVINNTSDNSVEVLNAAKSKNKWIALKVLDMGIAHGKGEAVIFGIKKASGKFIGFIDADGSSPAYEVNKLVSYLENNTDIDAAISSRYEVGSRISGDLPLQRHIMSRIFNIAVRGLFNLQYKDTQCGLKIFRADAIRSVIDQIVAKGWTFDVNILLGLSYYNYKVAEIGGDWYFKEGTKLSIRKAIPNVTREFFAMLKQVIIHGFTPNQARQYN